MWMAEACRRLAILRRYIVSDVLGWLADTVLLSGLLLTVSDRSSNALPTFMALVFWQLATKRVGSLSTSVRSERRYGTLPNLYLCGPGLSSVLLSRTAWAVLFDVVEVSCAAAPAAAVALALGVRMAALPMSATGFLSALFVGVIGLTGLGLLLAAVSLVFRQVGVFSLALDYLMLVWSGVLDPIRIQGWLQAVSVYLPLTDSISLVRKVTSGYRLTELLSQTELWRGLLVGTSYFVVGLAVFGVTERQARLRGTLFIQ